MQSQVQIRLIQTSTYVPIRKCSANCELWYYNKRPLFLFLPLLITLWHSGNAKRKTDQKKQFFFHWGVGYGNSNSVRCQLRCGNELIGFSHLKNAQSALRNVHFNDLYLVIIISILVISPGPQHALPLVFLLGGMHDDNQRSQRAQQRHGESNTTHITPTNVGQNAPMYAWYALNWITSKKSLKKSLRCREQYEYTLHSLYTFGKTPFKLE